MLVFQRELLPIVCFWNIITRIYEILKFPFNNVYTRDPNRPITQLTLLQLCFSNLITVSSPSLIYIDGILKSMRWGKVSEFNSHIFKHIYTSWGKWCHFWYFIFENGGKAVNVSINSKVLMDHL